MQSNVFAIFSLDLRNCTSSTRCIKICYIFKLGTYFSHKILNSRKIGMLQTKKDQLWSWCHRKVGITLLLVYFLIILDAPLHNLENMKLNFVNKIKANTTFKNWNQTGNSSHDQARKKNIMSYQMYSFCLTFQAFQMLLLQDS